ncbi:MAG: circularly permuted type 2 ATP-grasp protein [Halanaerobiales bacterium]
MEKIYDNLLEDLKGDREKYEKDYLKIKRGVDNSTAIYHGKPVPFLYQPLLFDSKDRKRLSYALNKLNSILKKVTKRYLNDKSFHKYFHFPELMEKLILIDPGYEVEYPVARFDLFYNYNDNYKFCELNTDGSSAMNEVRVFQREFRDSLIYDFLADEVNKAYNINDKDPLSGSELFYSLIDKILDNYRQYLKNSKGMSGDSQEKLTPNTAIMDFRGDGTVNEFEEFKKRFEEIGCKTVICDPRSLEYKGGKLYYEQMQIDLIYRRATTARLVEESSEIQDFIEAYENGDVCVVGGFRSQIPHNKIIFAVLHNREAVDFLTEEEYEFIKKHIPWTVEFKADDPQLRKKLIQNRKKYLLKPRDLFAGKGVYVGRDYDREEWDAIIDKIAGNQYNYLVQEFVNVPHRPMAFYEDGRLKIEEFNYIIGLFQYNQEIEGYYARGGRENVIAAAGESFTLPVYLINN